MSRASASTVERLHCLMPSLTRGIAVLCAGSLVTPKVFCCYSLLPSEQSPYLRIDKWLRGVWLQDAVIKLSTLSGWAVHTAAIGMRLPDDSLELLCAFVSKKRLHLLPSDEQRLRRAFRIWRYKRGFDALERGSRGRQSASE